MVDESRADDGAEHRFWHFIEVLRALPNPPAFAFDLEDVDRLKAAVAAFDAEEGAA